MNLYVSNLHQNSIESDLYRLFAPFGEVDSVQIIRDRVTNRPRGKALIIMPVEKQGKTALSKLDRTLLNGKVISVAEKLYDPGPKAF